MFLGPHPIWLQPSSQAVGFISAALSATEAPDTASFTARALVSGALGAVEGQDTAAFTATVGSAISAVLAATEAPDTAAFSGSVSVSAALSAVEAPDVAAFVSKVTVSGALTASEGPDIAAFSALTTNAVSAVLAATEGADTASFTAATAVSAALTTTEGPDTATFTASVAVSAALTATEGQDTAAFTARATVSSALAAVEGADTASFTARAAVTAALSATEGADVAAFSASVVASEDADAANYLNAQTTAPSSTERALVNDLVAGLKADGDWASFDWIVLLAAETAQAARLNLKNPAKSLTTVNLPTFTANRGFQGDGSSSYLDLGESYAASGNNFVQNSAMVGAWCNLQGDTNAARLHFGVASSDTGVSIRVSNSSGLNEQFSINDVTASSARVFQPSRTGHRTIARPASNSKRFYAEGSIVVNITVTSAAPTTANGTILRSRNNYANDRLAVFYSGGALADAAVARIHNRFNTYLTAKGAA